MRQLTVMIVLFVDFATEEKQAGKKDEAISAWT